MFVPVILSPSHCDRVANDERITLAKASPVHLGRGLHALLVIQKRFVRWYFLHSIGCVSIQGAMHDTMHLVAQLMRHGPTLKNKSRAWNTASSSAE